MFSDAAFNTQAFSWRSVGQDASPITGNLSGDLLLAGVSFNETNARFLFDYDGLPAVRMRTEVLNFQATSNFTEGPLVRVNLTGTDTEASSLCAFGYCAPYTDWAPNWGALIYADQGSDGLDLACFNALDPGEACWRRAYTFTVVQAVAPTTGKGGGPWDSQVFFRDGNRSVTPEGFLDVAQKVAVLRMRVSFEEGLVHLALNDSSKVMDVVKWQSTDSPANRSVYHASGYGLNRVLALRQLIGLANGTTGEYFDPLVTLQDPNYGVIRSANNLSAADLARDIGYLAVKTARNWKLERPTAYAALGAGAGNACLARFGSERQFNVWVAFCC